MIILLDHFDSFTYNIVDALMQCGKEVVVVRTGEKCVEECLSMLPEAIVLGPGPGHPEEAFLSKACLEKGRGKIPFLGICLGHQLIATFFGAKVSRASSAVHGKQSPIFHNNQGVFQGLPQGFLATRYHSLAIDRTTLPPCLEITAWTENDEIMGVKHKEFLLEGVQFHPESVASEYGHELFSNFLGRHNE